MHMRRVGEVEACLCVNLHTCSLEASLQCQRIPKKQLCIVEEIHLKPFGLHQLHL